MTSHFLWTLYKLQQRDAAKLEARLESDIFSLSIKKPTLIVLVFHISHKWIGYKVAGKGEEDKWYDKRDKGVKKQ